MTRPRSLVRSIVIAAIAVAIATVEASAQLVSPRVASVDIAGGALFAADSEVGVSFGTRLAAAELFGRTLRAGVHFDWWTADRRRSEIEVRDVTIGLSFWKTIGRATASVRPYLGAGTAVHSVDTSLADGRPFPGETPPQAARLEGVRIGASAFGGFSFRLTRTGAIRLLLEYRFTALARASHHEARLGTRLLLAAL